MAGDPDSNYGSYSLSNFQSSSSSISMSLSESDLVEDQPSTSGCSSEQPYFKQLELKKNRKEQVKRYLKELKGLVVQPRGNMGTLSALQHVVDKFKKIQDKEESPTKVGIQPEQVEDQFNLPFDEQDDINRSYLNTKDTLYITIQYRDLNIVAVSKNVSEVLGYPKPELLIGREICNFVHKKDIVTLNSSLSIHRDCDEEEEGSDNSKGSNEQRKSKFRIQRKLFYFRMRNYKGLEGGFNITSKDTEFQTFQANVTLDKRRKGSDGSPGNGDRNRITAVLKCVPLRSAYSIEGLKENWTFTTRHSLFCSYSHIDTKAIPLLGFLPQDIVGMSIFDFYHPDDIELLYGIYQQVVNSDTVPFKSRPFRIRVRNGDWVYVKTEWSRFVNPWSHRLEFVMGQHTVIKPPNRKDIFNQGMKEEININVTDKLVKLQQMIRELLLQPLVADKNLKKQAVPLKTEFTNTGYGETKMDSTNEELGNMLNDINATECSALSSPPPLIGTDEAIVYDQLNYTNNIKRFLLSQAVTSLSPSSDKKSSSTEDLADSPSVSDSVLELDISVPRPPSFGSSTKVLVSEQEREEVACSPAHFANMDCYEGTPPKEVTTATAQMSPPPSPRVNNNKDPNSKDIEPKQIKEKEAYTKVSLTRETLFKHTRRQEQLFIEQAKEENSSLLCKRSDKKSESEVPQPVKRLHSPDPSSDDLRIKSVKKEVSKLNEQKHDTGISSMKALGFEGISQPRSTAVFLPVNSVLGMYAAPSVSVMHPNSIPTMTMATSNADNTNYQQQNMDQDNMHWPYFPHSGVSFIPQVMEGFYQPGTGFFQPISRPDLQMTSSFDSTSSSLSSGFPHQTIHMPVPWKYNHHQQRMVSSRGRMPSEKLRKSLSSEMSSSQDETSSSVMYLLESCSQNQSSIHSIEGIRRPKRTHDPAWLRDAQWTSQVRFRYQLPRKKLQNILADDRDKLKQMHQPDLAVFQMKMLEDELDSTLPCLDMFEDESVLFPGDSDAEGGMSGAEKGVADCSEISDNHGSDNINLKWLFNDDISSGGEMSKQMDKTSGSDTKHDSDMESSPTTDRESLHDNDSSFSKSSDMTPSEERSVEEAGSSLKESDAAMSDTGFSGKSVFEYDDAYDSEGSRDKKCSMGNSEQTETDKNVADDAWFQKYFALLPLHFTDAKTDGPPWVCNAILNRKTIMKYHLKPKPLDQYLEEDRQKLEDMEQSDMVIQQINHFVEDVHMSPCTGSESPLCKTKVSKPHKDHLQVPDFHTSSTGFEFQSGKHSHRKHIAKRPQSKEQIEKATRLTDTLINYMFSVQEQVSDCNSEAYLFPASL